MIGKYRWLRLWAPIVGRAAWLFYPIAAIAGSIAWRVRPACRKRLIRNLLPLCDGDAERAIAEAKLAYRNLARYWVDVCSIPHRDMANFERDHLRILNPERLEVLSRPGPVMLVSAHAGSVELALQALTFRGRPFVALVEDLEPPEMARYLLQLRSAAGGTFYPADFGGVRACLEALKEGGVLGMLADRDIQGTGACVLLAGKPVKLPRGPWELARRTGATVIPVFGRRSWRDEFTLTIEQPFTVSPYGTSDAAVREAIEHWARLLEANLRRAPGQWTVLEDFWEVHRCGEG
jgi:KDO2-lipid IV(A) lauroyltransferase